MFLFVAATLLCRVAAATRLGISPAYENLDFEPGRNYSREITVYNSDGSGLNVTLSKNGLLSEYFELNESRLEIKPGEISKVFTVTVKFPEKIEQGNYETEIVALMEGAGKGMISTTLEVGMNFYTYVLSDKYVSMNFEITGANDKTFALTIKNIGQMRIDKASAVISVIEGAKEIINLSSEEFSLEKGESNTLRKRFTYAPGEYSARAYALYDGEKKLIAKAFEIGERKIEIRNSTVPEISWGEINRIRISADALWNKPIIAEANLLVYSGNSLVANVSGDKTEVFGTTEINFFWNTAGINPGVYRAVALLAYDNKTAEKEFEIKTKQSTELEKKIRQAYVKKGVSIALFFIAIAVLIAGLIFGKEEARFLKEKIILYNAIANAERRNLTDASRAYSGIVYHYNDLSIRHKKKLYPALMKLYSFIKEQKEKKAGMESFRNLK